MTRHGLLLCRNLRQYDQKSSGYHLSSPPSHTGFEDEVVLLDMCLVSKRLKRSWDTYPRDTDCTEGQLLSRRTEPFAGYMFGMLGMPVIGLGRSHCHVSFYKCQVKRLRRKQEVAVRLPRYSVI